MVDAYRNAAEKPEVKWAEHFKELHADINEEDTKYYLDILNQQDAWVPEQALSQMTEGHLKELFDASYKLHKMRQSNSYYYYYKKLIDKAILLLIEKQPDSFERLDRDQKMDVIGSKIEMPDEEKFYNLFYKAIKDPSVLDGMGSYFPGQNFEDILKRLVEEEYVLSFDLAKILQLLNAEYSSYYSHKHAKEEPTDEEMIALMKSLRHK